MNGDFRPRACTYVAKHIHTNQVPLSRPNKFPARGVSEEGVRSFVRLCMWSVGGGADLKPCEMTRSTWRPDGCQ